MINNNKNTPLVSVVIPFYSHADWLEEAIESVLEQTYKNLQIVVVNDGSDEDISSIITKYNDCILFIEQENKGAASARNNGISHCKGKYIAFLDSDDIWLPDKIEYQVELMEKTGAAWSHCSYKKFGNDVNDILSIKNFCGSVFPRILYSATIATPCVIIRKEILDKHSDFRFKENMKNGQDYYLWVKLSEKYPLYGIDRVLCLVRQRGKNTARKAKSQIIVRGMIYEYIVRDRKKTTTQLLYSSYRICGFFGPIIKKIRNPILGETLARLFYIIPYIVYKSGARRFDSNNNLDYIKR